MSDTEMCLLLDTAQNAGHFLVGGESFNRYAAVMHAFPDHDFYCFNMQAKVLEKWMKLLEDSEKEATK